MKHCNNDQPFDFSGIENAFRGLVSAQVSLGKELFKIASGAASNALGALSGLKSKMPGSSCCDIPEPCWMPVAEGEFTCSIGPGAKAELWLSVTNQDFQPHSYVAAGSDPTLVAISPTELTLGPKERGVFTATFVRPAGSNAKTVYEMVIWIVGCRSHYIRWEVATSGKNRTCCHEASIDDWPDYIVHWYDHFYCLRPCIGSSSGFVINRRTGS